MGQFGIETRKWLESAIRQRKHLIKYNKSQKPQHEIETAIDCLERQLSAYTFENDHYMARFIRNNISSIEKILPGAGSTSYAKRMIEFNDINKRSILISSGTRTLILTHP